MAVEPPCSRGVQEATEISYGEAFPAGRCLKKPHSAHRQEPASFFGMRSLKRGLNMDKYMKRTLLFKIVVALRES